MRKLLIFLLWGLSAEASVVGVSSHPLHDSARVFSAEMIGYLSHRHEVGGGIRYTQETSPGRLLDFSASGGQDSRTATFGGGMDFELLAEDVHQPRLSLKPYYQHQKFETQSSSYLGMAPALRKGFSIMGQELFPYLAIPSGIKIDNSNDEFVYYASLTLGTSMPLPGTGTDRFILSLEANKDLGSSSDYVGCLISWIWK